jgi:hypothetical protein
MTRRESLRADSLVFDRFSIRTSGARRARPKKFLPLSLRAILTSQRAFARSFSPRMRNNERCDRAAHDPEIIVTQCFLRSGQACGCTRARAHCGRAWHATHCHRVHCTARGAAHLHVSLRGVADFFAVL